MLPQRDTYTYLNGRERMDAPSSFLDYQGFEGYCANGGATLLPTHAYFGACATGGHASPSSLDFFWDVIFSGSRHHFPHHLLLKWNVHSFIRMQVEVPLNSRGNLFAVIRVKEPTVVANENENRCSFLCLDWQALQVSHIPGPQNHSTRSQYLLWRQHKHDSAATFIPEHSTVSLISIACLAREQYSTLQPV